MNEINELKLETMKELKNYLMKLIPALESVVLNFRNNEVIDAFEVLNQAIEGIGWSIDVIIIIKEYLEERNLKIDEFELKNAVEEFVEAYESKEIDVLADVIEFEIIDLLKRVQTKL